MFCHEKTKSNSVLASRSALQPPSSSVCGTRPIHSESRLIYISSVCNVFVLALSFLKQLSSAVSSECYSNGIKEVIFCGGTIFNRGLICTRSSSGWSGRRRGQCVYFEPTPATPRCSCPSKRRNASPAATMWLIDA